MKKYFVACMILILTLVFVTGCGSSNTNTSSNSETVATGESIIRMSVSGTPSVDPAVGISFSSVQTLVNLYDTLVFPNTSGGVNPWLAEKWEVSDNGMEYTFHLKKGIIFHDGEELKASDVKFSMTRLLAMGEGFSYLYSDVVDKVEAIDDNTVVFKLKKPYGAFISSLCRFYVLSEKQVIANKKAGVYGELGDYGRDWLQTHDAGSGPYTLTEFVQQDHVSAKKFDKFWGGWEENAPEVIKLIDNTQASTIRTLLSNKELEITDMWQSTENLKAMANIPGVKIAQYGIGSVQYMMYNNKKAPTDDVNFRKALSSLFDYDMISKNILTGSPIATSPVNSALKGAKAPIAQYHYDIDTAKKYLSASKYANQLDKYPVEILVNTDVADHEKIALAFQAAAAEVGLTVRITKAPWISIIDKVSTVESTPNIVCINTGVNFWEAGATLESRFSSKTVGTWEQAEWLQDPTIDAAIKDALLTPNETERFRKYGTIIDKIGEICPCAWLVDLNDKVAYQSEYVYWPTAESFQKGKVESNLMGYAYYFHDFKVYPDKK